MNLTLPTDSDERKEIPITSGVLRYFPAALAGIARVSKAGNDKHNPGEPLHHARGKSTDHADCIVRHLMDVNDLLAVYDRHVQLTPLNEALLPSILVEVSQLCWRALALSQELHERFGAPLAPGARLPDSFCLATAPAQKPGFPVTPGVYRDRGGKSQTVLKIDESLLGDRPHEYPARGYDSCWNLRGRYWNDPASQSPLDLLERIGDLPS